MLRLTFVLLLGTAAAVAQNALPAFEPMQPDVMGAGSNFTNAFADYDNDGDLDLFVGFDGKPNRLYRNDKGVFTDVACRRGRCGYAPDPRGGVGRLRCGRRSGLAARLHAGARAHRC